MTRLTIEILGRKIRAIQVKESEIAEAGFVDGGYGEGGQDVRIDYEGYAHSVTGYTDCELIESEGHPFDQVVTIAYGDPL